MRIFYTGSDIEDLAARGVRQLEVGPDVMLTDAAREQAEELGVILVSPGNKPAGNAPASAPTTKGGGLPIRPRGCQHGPLQVKDHQVKAAEGGGLMVEQLVEAVSALKKRGG